MAPWRQMSFVVPWQRKESKTMQIGLLTLDGEGRIASFNTAAEQILGYTAREVLGRPGEEILDGVASGQHLAGRAYSAEAASAAKAGSSSRSEDASAPQTSPRHDPADPAGNGAILVFQDERQLEKMENQLRHLDRLRSLDEFAAGIVHEIRNPLASISVNAQYILDQVEKHCRGLCTRRDRQGGDRAASSGPRRRPDRAGRLHEQIQDILADVGSIESIVKRVLDFAHPNKPQVRDEPVADIVCEVLRFSRMPLRQRGIRLVIDLGTQAKVRVDVSQMKQVLFNIVRNACDAMPRGGELHVRAARLRAETSGERHGSLYERRAADPVACKVADAVRTTRPGRVDDAVRTTRPGGQRARPHRHGGHRAGDPRGIP